VHALASPGRAAVRLESSARGCTLGYLTALLGTIAAILYAGIAPLDFHPPNGVAWLDPGPGLRFERNGIAYSVDDLRFEASGPDAGVSVELWVVPDDEPTGSLGQILSIYDGDRVDSLLIAQWKSGLVVRIRVSDEQGRVRYRELGELGLLFRGQRRHLAVTSGMRGTVVFVDGRETEHRSNSAVVTPGEAFEGRLIFGNSPAGGSPWSGVLEGAAVYRRALTAEEVARHDERVRIGGVASLAGEPGLVTLYSFAERAGDAVAGHGLVGPALRVPLHFVRLHRSVLQLPSLRGRRADSFGRDVFVNFVGFAPLGFFAAAVARRRRLGPGAAIVAATALGFTLSLGIELLQVELPARVSSATDLVNNLLGTAVGAWLPTRSRWAAKLVGTDSAGVTLPSGDAGAGRRAPP